MKNSILIFGLILSLFISCENDDTLNVSKVTNYPLIEVLGDDPIFVPQGGVFTDPGVIAKEGTEVIPTLKSFLGNYRGGNTLDVNKCDEYKVTYKAVNKDGFNGVAERKVIVYKTGDLVNSLEGVYTCTIKRNNLTPNANYINIKYIYIWKNTDGTYGISDTFGGWYEYGRALGISYITPGGLITALNIPGNSFTYGPTLTNTGFGGSANINGFTVNPTTKKIVITSVWITGTNTFNFEATLTQVQL